MIYYNHLGGMIMDNSYIIDLTRLKSGIDEYIFIDEDLDIKNTSNKIIEIKKVHINVLYE